MGFPNGLWQITPGTGFTYSNYAAADAFSFGGAIVNKIESPKDTGILNTCFVMDTLDGAGGYYAGNVMSARLAAADIYNNYAYMENMNAMSSMWTF